MLGITLSSGMIIKNFWLNTHQPPRSQQNILSTTIPFPSPYPKNRIRKWNWHAAYFSSLVTIWVHIYQTWIIWGFSSPPHILAIRHFWYILTWIILRSYTVVLSLWEFKTEWNYNKLILPQNESQEKFNDFFFKYIFHKKFWSLLRNSYPPLAHCLGSYFSQIFENEFTMRMFPINRPYLV